MNMPKKMPRLSKPVWGVVIFGIIVLAALPMLGLAHYTTTNPRFCLTCHGTGETADIGQQSVIHPKYSEVGCIDCHADAGGFQHLVVDGYRGGFDAGPERVSGNCVRCHENMVTKSDTTNFKYNNLNINIPHDKHLAIGALCTDCHRDIAHDLNINQTNKPRMAYCFQCHSSSTGCNTCHPDGPPAQKATIPPPAKLPQTPSADAAQATWEIKCSKCHALYPPTLHTGQEWGPIVDRMSGYTGSDITGEDAAVIISYLNTVAKQP